jgi:hypothetical protein
MAITTTVATTPPIAATATVASDDRPVLKGAAVSIVSVLHIKEEGKKDGDGACEVEAMTAVVLALCFVEHRGLDV